MHDTVMCLFLVNHPVRTRMTWWCLGWGVRNPRLHDSAVFTESGYRVCLNAVKLVATCTVAWVWG